jgi:hypothetical protein
MHVWRSACYLPESGRLECAPPTSGVLKPVIAPGNPRVMNPLISEIGADVTQDTVRLPAEERQPRALVIRQGTLFAIHESIEPRSPRKD